MHSRLLPIDHLSLRFAQLTPPMSYCFQHGNHGFAKGRQFVLHAGRHFGENAAFHNAVASRVLSWMLSIFSVISGISFFSSLKRFLSWRRYQSTTVFHLPPMFNFNVNMG